MGSGVSNNDDLGDTNPMSDFGGEDKVDDKPFDDTPFDAGVEASEEDNPEKYIQQLSGKLGQSLRKYTKEMGEPNFDLEKFAINSVISATNSSEMDQQDQTDIISKIKSSKTDSEKDDGLGGDAESDAESDAENDAESDEGGLDLSGIDMEESHNPNHDGKTVFKDCSLGVEENGMEENKYLTRESIKEMVNKIFLNENDKPLVKPKPIIETKPKPSKSKPWLLPEQKPNPNPKAEDKSIVYIKDSGFDDNEKSISISFDVDGIRFVENFTNSGEIMSKAKNYDEPSIYLYKTDILSNGKEYGIGVKFYGDLTSNLELAGFAEGDKPKIFEI